MKRGTVAASAVALLLLAGCAAEVEPEVITETVTETVEVEVVPQACIEALDAADGIISALAEYGMWALETEGGSLSSTFEGAEDLTEWTANIEEQNEWLEGVNSRMDSEAYDALHSECHEAWLNQ